MVIYIRLASHTTIVIHSYIYVNLYTYIGIYILYMREMYIIMLGHLPDKNLPQLVVYITDDITDASRGVGNSSQFIFMREAR